MCFWNAPLRYFNRYVLLQGLINISTNYQRIENYDPRVYQGQLCVKLTEIFTSLRAAYFLSHRTLSGACTHTRGDKLSSLYIFFLTSLSIDLFIYLLLTLGIPSKILSDKIILIH